MREPLQMSKEDDALARKLGAFEPLGIKERAKLRELQNVRLQFQSGREIVYEGQHIQSAYILRTGWACSYKRLRDGGRQIIDIHIPGDFLGVRSLLLRKSDHSFVTLTDVEVAKIDRECMEDVFRITPRLALALLWAASRDEAMVVEHLVSIGRRGALERTAHFLLELGARLKLVGSGTGDRYHCPISQSILSDTLGMTTIHLNRVLRQLRESKLVIFREGVVTIPNMERAAELTGFDLSYLDHGTQPKK
jgi:CRP-like cAMP-binding protein